MEDGGRTNDRALKAVSVDIAVAMIVKYEGLILRLGPRSCRFVDSQSA